LSLMDKACKDLGRQVNIMEVCGTHTVSIFRSGIASTLPNQMELLSGPGCPVCVTPLGYIDLMLKLAEKDDVLIATYGDMLRVPGSDGSLERKNKNNNVRIVLSSEDALELAKDNPEKVVVFIAVGFETTTPATAVAVSEAKDLGLDNFSVLSGHKRVIPAMQALLSDDKNKIDAFLCPGHVTVIIGSDAYQPIVSQFSKPCVVAGFEPMQIIQGLGEISSQLIEHRAEVRSVYEAVVTQKGNTTAQQVIEQCFEPADGYWRGLGKIDKSTYRLKPEYEKFDACKRFGVEEKPVKDTSGCRCGEVLCGLIEPTQCALFGKKCTPDTPVGPCMVSSEGACAAWYKYGPKGKRAK
jgi:hydrogenase expression/formation protein HypD